MSNQVTREYEIEVTGPEGVTVDVEDYLRSTLENLDGVDEACPRCGGSGCIESRNGGKDD